VPHVALIRREEMDGKVVLYIMGPHRSENIMKIDLKEGVREYSKLNLTDSERGVIFVLTSRKPSTS